MNTWYRIKYGFIYPIGIFLSIGAFFMGILIERNFIPKILYADEYKKGIILVDSFYLKGGSRRSPTSTLVIGKVEGFDRIIHQGVPHDYRLNNIRRIPIWYRLNEHNQAVFRLYRKERETVFNRNFYLKRFLVIFGIFNMPLIIILFLFYRRRKKKK